MSRRQTGTSLRIGDKVSAPATRFDSNESHSWSKVVFGTGWATARIKGVVIRVSGTSARVRFEDDDTQQCFRLRNANLLILNKR